MLKYLKKFNSADRLVISNDHKILVALSSKTTLYSMTNLSPITSFVDIKNPVYVALSDDNKYMAVKSTSGKIGLYSLETFSLIQVYKFEVEGCNLFFTPDSQYIVNGDWDGHIRLININSHEVTPIKSYPNCMIVNMEYDQVEHVFYFKIYDRGKYSLETASTYYSKWKYESGHLDFISETNHIKGTIREENLVYHYKLNQYIYITQKENLKTLFVVNDHFNQTIFQLDLGEDSAAFNRFCISPSGDYLVVLTNNRFLLFKTTNYQLIKEYSFVEGTFIYYSHDEKYLSICSYDIGLFLIDFKDLLTKIDVENRIETYEPQFDDYKNILVNSGINTNSISKIPDELMIDVIAEYTLSKIDEIRYNISKDFFEALDLLPKGLFIFYHIWWLECEIDNGGVEQYFYNNGDATTLKNLLSALKAINAKKTHKFIQQVIKKLNHNDEVDWNVILDEYELLSEDVEELRLTYLPHNLEQFM